MSGPLRTRALLHRLGVVVLIAVAYYVGARVGGVLKFEALTPSVVWPPNAILTATLLLSAPRRWPLYLAAALPAHVAFLFGRMPTSLLLAVFLTNCSEAMLAAGSVRYFAGAGPRVFESLRSVGVFIVCAGFIAPFVTSFADAGAVALLNGESYWLVWTTRFFANVLTALTVVPTIVIVVARAGRWLRSGFTRRSAEALTVWLGLFIVNVAPFQKTPAIVSFGLPSVAPLAFSLPFLVWAAVRLGPAGTSAALLTVEVLAVVTGIRLGGPFADLTPLHNVISLQILLSVVAIPLMCLAALIQERTETHRTLEARFEFERLLSKLSRAFVHLPSHDVDRAIDGWLGQLGEYLGAQYIAVFQLSATGQLFVRSHAWAMSPSVEPPSALTADALWVEHIDMPLLITDVGVLSLGPRTDGHLWAPGMTNDLRIVAEVFGNALARKKAEEALRASETMKAAILSSLPTGVAVLDRHGRVVAINESWHRCASSSEEVTIGASHRELARSALTPTSLYFPMVLGGISSVVAGSDMAFVLEYPCASPAPERWLALTVLPLNRPEGGAVVSLADVTERKRMEFDAEQTRQEIAHFSRVSTMGELTASLAHELNQPLTGILANAQAAQRLLAAKPPNLEEVRQSLADIVSDDQRAGEVIRRLRELLRKGKTRPVVLDLNGLIGEVVKLLNTDAMLRGCVLSLDLDPKLDYVKADRIQVQQVLLNLLVNAMEAMTSTTGRGRLVIIRTERDEGHMVRVSVCDMGCGIPPAVLPHIFQAFYSTKGDGMGMGLSVARSIVEAHGGRIWVTNNPGGGTTFHFTLVTPDHEQA